MCTTCYKNNHCHYYRKTPWLDFEEINNNIRAHSYSWNWVRGGWVGGIMLHSESKTKEGIILERHSFNDIWSNNILKWGNKNKHTHAHIFKRTTGEGGMGKGKTAELIENSESFRNKISQNIVSSSLSIKVKLEEDHLWGSWVESCPPL